jgi:hypothetical protein
MSYSAYLWHQPIIAFVKIQSYVSIEADFEILSTISLSIFMGWLSWKYIERPFRSPIKNSRPLTASCIAMVGISLLVGLLYFLVLSYPKSLPIYERALKVVGPDVTNIFDSSNIKTACIVEGSNIRKCPLGAGSDGSEIILWGDSYAGAFYHGLNEEMKLRGIKGEALYRPGCPPIVGLSRPAIKPCTANIHLEILQKIVKRPEVSVVLLHGNILGPAKGGSNVFIDGSPADIIVIEKRLAETREILNKAGKKLVIVEQGPRFTKHVAKFHLKKRLLGLDDTLTLSRQWLLSKHKIMDSLANSSDLYIRTTDFFCDSSYCNSTDHQGNLLFSDNDHLTPRSSRLLARYVINQLDKQTSDIKKPK